MAKNSFLQAIFKGPKYSLARIQQNNRGNCNIGEVVPVFARTVGVGHSIELNLSHLVRFMPTVAPTMEGYNVVFESFAVPVTSLGYAERKERDIMDFYNIKENGGEVLNPFSKSFREMNAVGYYDDFSERGLVNFFKLGSLGDYLNLASFKSFRDYVRKWLALTPLFDGPIFSRISASGVAIPASVVLAYRYFINDNRFIEKDNATLDLTIDGTSVNFASLVSFSPRLNLVPSSYNAGFDSNSNSNVFAELFLDDFVGAYSGYSSFRSLFRYICDEYPQVKSYYFSGSEVDGELYSAFFNATAALHRTDVNLDFLSVFYDLYKIDSQTIFREWFENEIVGKILFNQNLHPGNGTKYGDENNNLMTMGFLPRVYDENARPVNLEYFAAYWKIIADWFINTNIDGNPDDFFTGHCKLLSSGDNYVELKPFYRRWPNDIFTSCVAENPVYDVRIPANATIPEFREINAFQKLVDLFKNTGDRLRDVVHGVTGLRPSAMASEMSVPIGVTLSSWLGVNSVLQTSETTPDSPQAAYAGIGADSSESQHLLKYINNEQPCPVIVMVLMHVTQKASYFQGIPRCFRRSSIYDFVVPQLANIGEQEVYTDELYFDYDSQQTTSDVNEIFGFNRRYYDWFLSQSEVHGDLRDSLDYWHGAREFDEKPSLDSEFIGIDPERDHLQRIFANTSEFSRPIVYNIRFDGASVVDLPRYIEYDL